MRIKVCGLTRPEQVQEIEKLGIEFGGFIFYPRSPRYVYKSMPSTQIKKIKGKLNKVGVFVDAEIEDVLRAVDDCGLYLVQLHGNESPKYCEKISNYITVVKVFRISGSDNILWKIKDYYDVADMFMFDTDGSGYGGTGKKFDWEILNDAQIKKPFFLSGGIDADDAEKLKNFKNNAVGRDLFAVDINSRFEVAPGIKDIGKIKDFKKAVNRM